MSKSGTCIFEFNHVAKCCASILIMLHRKSHDYNANLTLSTLHASTAMFASSVDPDEPARNEPSHQDLHYLQVILSFLRKYTPVCKWTSPDISRSNFFIGLTISWTSPCQLLWGEMVKAMFFQSSLESRNSVFYILNKWHACTFSF